MFKKLFLTLALCLPLIASAQSVKIGLVNVQAVMTALPEYKAGQTQYEDLQKKYSDQLDQLRTEGQRMVEEYQNLPEDTADAIRQHKANALQQQDQTIQTFMQTAQQDLQKKEAEIMQTIQTKMSPAFESVGKEGGYTLILPLDSGNVLYYGAPAEDITSKILSKLGIQ